MFPSDLELRELGLEDLDAVIQLVHRCDCTYLDWAPSDWRPPDLDWYRERWEERLPHPEVWARGAFDQRGAVVGFVAFRAEPDRSRVAHVNAVFVEPRRWRQGIARSLLSLAEEEMRARGYRFARLWTPEHAPACLFYERVGWRPEGQRDWFEPLGLHVVGYEKPLSPPTS